MTRTSQPAANEEKWLVTNECDEPLDLKSGRRDG